MTPSNNQPVVRRGVVAVVSRHDRFLVIRRSAQVAAPGRLCFPGGGIEHGESEISALVRELAEELGVHGYPRRRLWSSRTDWQVQLSWWQTEIAADAQLRPCQTEVAEVHWMTAAQLHAARDVLSSNQRFLEAMGLHPAGG